LSSRTATSYGKELKGKRIGVIISVLVTDAPLHAWATGTKYYSSKLDGYGPCTRNKLILGVTNNE
jgi:hypothetical protein